MSGLSPESPDLDRERLHGHRGFEGEPRRSRRAQSEFVPCTVLTARLKPCPDSTAAAGALGRVQEEALRSVASYVGDESQIVRARAAETTCGPRPVRLNAVAEVAASAVWRPQ